MCCSAQLALLSSCASTSTQLQLRSFSLPPHSFRSRCCRWLPCLSHALHGLYVQSICDRQPAPAPPRPEPSSSALHRFPGVRGKLFTSASTLSIASRDRLETPENNAKATPGTFGKVRFELRFAIHNLAQLDSQTRRPAFYPALSSLSLPAAISNDWIPNFIGLTRTRSIPRSVCRRPCAAILVTLLSCGHGYSRSAFKQ